RDALRHPAVAMFIERAAAASTGFTFDDADVDSVAAICRRLDGVPLALELAATRVDAFRPCDLLRLLEQRLDLLDRGRHFGPARHRSLSATLAWSYDLLCTAERALFRRLS